MGLFTPDLALHPIKFGGRIERREDDDSLRDLSLRLGSPLTGDQGVPSSKRRLVLGLELPQLVLQLGDGLALHPKCSL